MILFVVIPAKAGIVRQKVHMTREVEKSSPGLRSLKPEADCNCVAARRGGEQQEASNQSVVTDSFGNELDSAGRDRRACDSKAKSNPSLNGSDHIGKRTRSMLGAKRQVVGDRMVAKGQVHESGRPAEAREGVHSRVTRGRRTARQESERP